MSDTVMTLKDSTTPVLQPLDKTKETAQALFMQGFGYKTIGDKTGLNPETIKTWIRRGKWSDLRGKLSTHLTQSITTPLIAVTVQNASKQVREDLSQSIAATTRLLSAKQPKSLKQALAIQAELEPTVRNASKIFGWDQQSQSTLLDIKSLSSEPVLESAITSECMDTTTVASANQSMDCATMASTTVIEQSKH